MPRQPSLFADQVPAPAGLSYAPDFLTPDEERALIARIATLPLEPFQFGNYEGRRRVIYYGVRYDFSRRRIEPADDLPDWIMPIAARAERFGGLQTGSIRHALFTEYDIGAGIGWHRDKKQFDEVFGVSLASACTIRFRRKRGDTWERAALACEPRSLYVLRGAARSVWEHSIAPVKARRYSITFRTMDRTMARMADASAVPL